MKGVVFTTDREMYTMDFAEPLHKSVGEVIGGWIEIVRPRGLTQPFCMIVNETGLQRELPLNIIGSFWYGTHMHGAPIVGNIVVMKEGIRNGEQDLVGLTDQEAAAIMRDAAHLTNGLIRETAPPQQTSAPEYEPEL